MANEDENYMKKFNILFDLIKIFFHVRKVEGRSVSIKKQNIFVTK